MLCSFFFTECNASMEIYLKHGFIPYTLAWLAKVNKIVALFALLLYHTKFYHVLAWHCKILRLAPFVRATILERRYEKFCHCFSFFNTCTKKALDPPLLILMVVFNSFFFFTILLRCHVRSMLKRRQDIFLPWAVWWSHNYHSDSVSVFISLHGSTYLAASCE